MTEMKEKSILQYPGQTLIKNEKGKKAPLSLCYPPPHLYHILYELFKNSMRATVEKHRTSSDLPGIEVLVAKGDHDVSIRISDQVYSLKSKSGDQYYHTMYRVPVVIGVGILRKTRSHFYKGSK